MSVRVLTMLHSFEPGGVERIALRLVRRWRADGVDAPLWLGRGEGPMATEFGDVAYDSPRRASWIARVAETGWMITHLPVVIGRTRPDVILVAGNSYTVVAVAMKLWFGARCPPIVARLSNDLDRRDLPQPVRWFYHHWVRLQGRLIDQFVVIAPSLREQAVARTGVAPSRVAVVANPALDDAPIRSVVNANGEGRRFLFVGRLTAQKDVSRLLHAFGARARPADWLTIVGDGPLRRSLVRQADRLKLGDRVTFSGHRSDVAAILARHDCLVLSSRYEGLPSVAIEALQAGLAVIATESSPAVGSLLEGLATLIPVSDDRALGAALAADLAVPDAGRVADRIAPYRLSHAAPAYRRLFEAVSRQAPACQSDRPHAAPPVERPA